MKLKVGALFAGYGGIELALAQVAAEYPAVEIELVWYCEVDKAASAILAHRYPGVPNLGDVTKVDWAWVAATMPVDVITGGSPCQDLSHAGKRAGMKAGTRSGLWASMCDAIDIIRPRLVIWENVRGALSAAADSALEQCPGCVGGGDDGPVLRALGRVLGDLADLRYDARWYGLRAADVGAAHGRFRIFLFATPADADNSGWGEHGWPVAVRAEQSAAQHPGADVPHVPGQLTLLPTPAVNDMGAAYTPETWNAWTERMKSAHGNGNGHGKSLAIEAQRLLPTPVADNSRGLPSSTTDYASLPNVAARLLPTPSAQHRDRSAAVSQARVGSTHQVELADLIHESVQDWREYEAAIRRQEHATGRTAPPPTETGPKGNPRLSPRFVEWLMGLPECWVTDVPGISRNDQLKALGNGVVPAQCAAALRAFLHDTAKEVAA